MATITDLHITGLSSKKERLAGKEQITYTTKIRHAHIEDYSGGFRGGAMEAIHCLYDTSCSEYKGMDDVYSMCIYDSVKHNQTQKI